MKHRSPALWLGTELLKLPPAHRRMFHVKHSPRLPSEPGLAAPNRPAQTRHPARLDTTQRAPPRSPKPLRSDPHPPNRPPLPIHSPDRPLNLRILPPPMHHNHPARAHPPPSDLYPGDRIPNRPRARPVEPAFQLLPSPNWPPPPLLDMPPEYAAVLAPNLMHREIEKRRPPLPRLHQRHRHFKTSRNDQPWKPGPRSDIGPALPRLDPDPPRERHDLQALENMFQETCPIGRPRQIKNPPETLPHREQLLDAIPAHPLQFEPEPDDSRLELSPHQIAIARLHARGVRRATRSVKRTCRIC